MDEAAVERNRTEVNTATTSIGEGLVERIRDARSLPSPPIVAAKLIELGEDPDVGLADLVDVLRNDPALSARILRLANSPLYARRRRAENLHQAVVMLGLDAVFTAALSLTLVGDRNALGSFGPSFRNRWTRSVHAAVVAQLLAARCGGAVPGTAFLAALVQDLGILVLGQLEPDLYATLPADATHEQFVERERAVLGIDHAAVGAILLEEWRLPEDVVHAVSRSHEGGVSSGNADRLADIVAVSALVADGVLGASQQLVAATAAAEHLLGVDALEFSKLLDGVAETLPDLAPLLEADAPSAQVLTERAADAMIARQMQQRHAIEQLQVDLAGVSEVARQLEIANRSDLLTGLLNRRYLHQVTQREFDVARTHGDGLSVLFLDLDDFRDVNEQFGHHGGDMALRVVADRLTATLRDEDLIGRFGGDEFLVLLPATLGRQAEIVAQRIVSAMAARPFVIEPGIEHEQTVTVGIAALDELTHVSSFEELLKAADEALYQAKHAGKSRWCKAVAAPVTG
jgi:diguanylate cyclase (GGDEF)-like protein